MKTAAETFNIIKGISDHYQTRNHEELPATEDLHMNMDTGDHQTITKPKTSKLEEPVTSSIFRNWHMEKGKKTESDNRNLCRIHLQNRTTN